MDIILSSRNPSKAEQIRAVFADSAFRVISLSEAGIDGEAIEDGTTLEQNAFKKAHFAWERSKSLVMADDTGFFITALDGIPGVNAARWAGEEATTEEITRHTLTQLEGHSNRSAFFETVVVVITPEGEKYFFSGRVSGHILEAPRTKAQPKMPYSPIFVPEGHDRVWAEMTVEEENAISHRGKAFRTTRRFLEWLYRS